MKVRDLFEEESYNNIFVQIIESAVKYIIFTVSCTTSYIFEKYRCTRVYAVSKILIF